MVRISRRRAAALALLLLRLRRERRRRFWIHPSNQSRRERGQLQNLIAELRRDSQRHHGYFRMSVEKFDEILSIIGPDLRRQTTNFRNPVSPEERLAMALRYLASGDSLISLANNFRLGHSTVVNSVHMVFAAIEDRMMDRFLPVPTEETWSAVADSFWSKWDFPNCLGALGAKLVHVTAPAHSGLRLCDSRNFSLRLMALIDAECSAPLPGAPQLGPAPFAMVGDATFPLKTYLMTPYAAEDLDHGEKLFNYRLSRARLTVERTFGILSARWRVLLQRINLSPENVNTLVIAACILHNFLHNPGDNRTWLEDSEERGEAMEDALNTGPPQGGGAAAAARAVYTAFFSSPAGGAPWQEEI
ncbi:putative nuclease HARBI1 isoform X2 [Oryzias melastigma]|uniref:Protein ALP1-like n=1 Tax=Oryzias melastigma TaxID=30732 RepID=A0A3B3E1M5_ORYME|nr:putative nuclease HARBI1 isoform X2 [Oryzias melastigma]